MWRRNRDASRKASDFFSAQTGATFEQATREAAASDETRRGMATFSIMAGTKKKPHFKKGNLFEAIEAKKYNEDAARKGIELRAYVTAAERRPKDPADIEIRNIRGDVIKKAQLKSHSDGRKAVHELRREDYDGMHKQVLKGKSGDAPDIKEELDGGGASSGGTSSKELERATRNPRAYTIQQEIKQVSREAAVKGAQAVAAGVIVGGALSAITNFIAYSREQKEGKRAIADVAKDSAKSGIRSGSSAGLGSFIRHIGSKLGSKALSKSNVATAVASGVVDSGVAVYKFAKGEITAEEAATRLGDTGCSTMSGIYLGAAGGAVFGPAGAIAGSVVGYMLAASVYQSCIAVLQEANLAEEEAERVVALCEEAARAMDEKRRQFETKLANYLDVRQVSFDKHFKQIDDALFADDQKKAISGLSGLARSFGKELRLAKFEDFQEFMVESNEPLRL